MSELSTLGTEIAAAYEAESDTNKFTDAEKAKMAAIGPAVTACFDASGYDFRLKDSGGTSRVTWTASTGIFKIANTSAVNAKISVQNTGTGGRQWSFVSGVPGVSNDKVSIYDDTAAATRLTIDASGNILPGADNTQNLASASTRMKVLHAGTATINTSDKRLKTDIKKISAAEARVALAAKGLLKKFRFKDAVEAKGDGARWHFGIIAQDLIAAFEAEGLDAMAYGCVCFDEWWTSASVYSVMVSPAKYDGKGIEIEPAVYEDQPVTLTHERAEDAPEGAEYHSRYGVRYEELLAFIVAAM